MNPATFQKRVVAAWKKLDRRIERRDQAMKNKTIGAYKSDDTEDEVDVPLGGVQWK